MGSAGEYMDEMSEKKYSDEKEDSTKNQEKLKIPRELWILLQNNEIEKCLKLLKELPCKKDSGLTSSVHHQSNYNFHAIGDNGNNGGGGGGGDGNNNNGGGESDGNGTTTTTSSVNININNNGCYDDYVSNGECEIGEYYDLNMIENDSGKGLIHYASILDSIGMMKFLASQKSVHIDLREQFNQVTALQYACQKGNLEIVEYLLKECKGRLDVNKQDKDGYTALHYACVNKHKSIVEQLVKHPLIKVNIVDTWKRTALHRAVEHFQTPIVRILLSHPDIKQSVNCQNEEGWTPLHHASYNQLRTCCMILLKAGANSEIQDKKGKKALYWGYGYFESEDGSCTCPKGAHNHDNHQHQSHPAHF